MFSLLFDGYVGEMVAPSHYSDRFRELMARRDPEKVIKWLREKEQSADGVDMDFSNIYEDIGISSIHMAVLSGSVELCVALLSLGADVNALSATLDTPLHFACGGDHPAVACLLLLSGADPAAMNEAGTCPLDVCVSSITRDRVGRCAALCSARARQSLSRSEGGAREAGGATGIGTSSLVSPPPPGPPASGRGGYTTSYGQHSMSASEARITSPLERQVVMALTLTLALTLNLTLVLTLTGSFIWRECCRCGVNSSQ